MKVRKLEENDVARCLNIYNYYILNTQFSFEEKGLSLEEFSARAKRICSEYPYLVIENDEGVVVGYAYLDVFNPRSACRKKTADLSIYVDHACTHGGYGKALLNAIEAEAKNKGLRNIISLVTTANKASLAFHLKNGFLLEGEIKDIAEKFGQSLGLYYLRKPL